MRTYIRRFAAIPLIIVAAAVSTMAQESRPVVTPFNQKQVFKALETCLQTNNVPGFVESALYTVVECKDRYPDLDYSRLLNTVNEVAQENDNSSIRYKAYLAGMYLSHASDIQVTPISNSDNHEYLFKQIADQLEAKFLALDGSHSIADKK